MSTFSGLNTAYRGLSAAKAGIDVAGQNIANSRTEGYTRQRLNTSAIGGPSMAGKFSVGVRPGGGVNIDGIARLGDMHLDARVRASAAVSGFSAVRAGVFSDLESALHEPGANGISTQLQSFWASWQELSNSPGEATQSGLLLQQSQVLAQQISSTYTEFDNQWSQVRGEVRDLTAELNGAAAQLADLNGRIRQATAAGGSVNELLDQRSLLATTIAAIAGGTIRDAGDGTIDVYIGGNALVTGTTARTVNVIGSNTMAGSDTSPVTLEWAHRPGSAISLDGGELAGAVSTLAPAAAGGGIAKAAESLNNFAQKLADAVNTVHRTGFSAAAAPTSSSSPSPPASRPPRASRSCRPARPVLPPLETARARWTAASPMPSRSSARGPARRTPSGRASSWSSASRPVQRSVRPTLPLWPPRRPSGCSWRTHPSTSTRRT